MGVLDGYTTRHAALDKLIREIDRCLDENDKEGAESTYKQYVKKYYDLKLWDQLDTSAKYYYLDVLDIYERKLRHHVYKKKEPETLSDKIDRLV